MTFLGTVSTHPATDDTIPRVVMPFASSGPAFEAAKLNLAVQGIVPRLFQLEGEFAYHLMLRRLWAEGRPFMLVEQDICPWPGALVQAWECEHPWCGFPYFVHGQLRSYLGCVKFDPKRLGDLPLPDELQRWATLDLFMQRALLERGHREHRHGPAVAHLNLAHARVPSGSVVHPKFWEAEKP